MNKERLIELIDAYIDQALAPADKAELEKFIVESDEARRLYWEHIQMHAQVREIMQEAGAFKTAQAETALAPRRQLSAYRVLALAASLMIVAGVWWFTQSGSVKDGCLVETGKGQKSALRFDGEDTLIEMAENTKLKVVGAAVVPGAAVNAEFVRSGPRKVIEIESGSIKVSVAKQTDGRSFIVRSAQAEIRVVGTKFSVGVGVDRKKTRVDVLEGVVNVRQLPDGAEVAVPASVWASVEEGKAVEVSANAFRFVEEFLLPDEIRNAQGGNSIHAGFASDGRLLWVVNPGTTLLYSVDPQTKTVKDRIDLSGSCKSLFALGGGIDCLWAIGEIKGGDCQLLRIYPSNGRCDETGVPVAGSGALNSSLAYGGGYVWIWEMPGKDVAKLRKVDPATQKVLGSVLVPNPHGSWVPTLMWFDGGLCYQAPQHLVRFDPASGNALVRNMMPRGRGNALVTGSFKVAGESGGRCWILNCPSRRVTLFESLSSHRGE
ncbi:MAG: hypothetical protein C0404_04090 [Verrucomicrobia bacterium]|nr:hypothetical protein [Verrucomicrobiota bacterium]